MNEEFQSANQYDDRTTAAVRSEKFLRQLRKTKPAPDAACQPDGILVGLNEHAGET